MQRQEPTSVGIHTRTPCARRYRRNGSKPAIASAILSAMALVVPVGLWFQFLGQADAQRFQHFCAQVDSFEYTICGSLAAAVVPAIEALAFGAPIAALVMSIVAMFQLRGPRPDGAVKERALVVGAFVMSLIVVALTALSMFVASVSVA